MVTAKALLNQARTSSFWRDRWVIALIGLAFILTVAGFAHVASRYPTLPEFLPLHYNAIGDVDYIGTRIDAFRIPAFGLVIWLFNFALSLFIYDREPLASRLLMGASSAASALLLAAIVRIVV